MQKRKGYFKIVTKMLQKNNIKRLTKSLKKLDFYYIKCYNKRV